MSKVVGRVLSKKKHIKNITSRNRSRRRTTSLMRNTRNKKRKKTTKNPEKNTFNKMKDTITLSNVPGNYSAAKNKKFINIVKKAHINGVKTIIIDDGDIYTKYNVANTMKKINKKDTKKILKYF